MRTYVPMDPATYCLQFTDDALALLPRIEAELAKAEGSPRIEVTRLDDLVAFRCSTWEPILKARVAEALAAVFDHGAWERNVRPVS
jgi:hypothetical protein